MSSFPGSPRTLKGGIVVVDPTSGTVQRIIPLQYNPDTLSRTLQVKGVGPESGDRLEALRLKGPPVETIKLEAEIDATDQLESGDTQTVQMGLHPALAALEILVYPSSAVTPIERGLRILRARSRSSPPKRRSRFSCSAPSGSRPCALPNSALPKKRSTST